MVVATALAVLVVIVMMLVMVVLVFVFMVVATALAVLVVIVMMFVMVMLVFKLLKNRSESVRLFHSVKNHLAVKLVPGSGHYNRIGIDLAEHCNTSRKLIITHVVGVAENNRTRVLNLIVVELTEVLHIHLALARIRNCRKAVENSLVRTDALYRTNNVRKLADTRRLDNNSVGSVLVKHLFKSLAEVADKTAANAARIHFGDFNARILQKSAVNANFAEFVFDKHKLFTAKRFADKLFYKCCLSGTEKAGDNINLSHNFLQSALCACILQ